ncbi:MAG: hypothetical protein WCR54_05835 [Clostridia bacterium]
MIGLFFPKTDLVWKTEKPDDTEAAFFVCNHTKLYAPIAFLLQKPKIRVWGNYYFLFYSTCWNHLKTKVLPSIKFHHLLYPLAFLLTPIIVLTFRALEPIPVYHYSAKIIYDTFGKSIETKNDGISQVVFPERTENKINKYSYEFNRGFPLVSKNYYNKTGKLLKFYPVYCAQKLHQLVVGDPIEYDPNIPMKKQREIICNYLQDSIAKLGDSLPAHEPVLYVDKNENDK